MEAWITASGYPPEDCAVEPTKLGFRPGEIYSKRQLLAAMLVHSCNDAAVCLARNDAGSVDSFAGLMNAKAAQLGAANSHFVNPNGLPRAGQFSTARDMARIAFAAYHNLDATRVHAVAGSPLHLQLRTAAFPGADKPAGYSFHDFHRHENGLHRDERSMPGLKRIERAAEILSWSSLEAPIASCSTTPNGSCFGAWGNERVLRLRTCIRAARFHLSEI